MNLHSLKNTPGSRREKMRVGRGIGSGKGKTCGRGHKGQLSRKGHKQKPGFEGGQMKLLRRIPKRGFTSHVGLNLFVINLSDLNGFSDGAVVDGAALKAKKLMKGRFDGIKVLGTGELKKKLTVKATAFSAAAKAAIEAAGGICESTAKTAGV